MAKSIKDYIGDFDTLRDKLLFAMGDLAQIPQRATNLMPRVQSFIDSGNPVLNNNGKELMSRITAVRTNARKKYDEAQALINEMLGFKASVEANPLYAKLVAGDTFTQITSVLSNVLGRSEDSKFLEGAIAKSASYAGKVATMLADLTSYSAEVKTLETLAQKTADFATGKGLLPNVEPAAAEAKPALSVGAIAAGVAAVAAGIYLLRRK